ncbi:PH domain-containing protein [Brevibacillus borstelensis]|uniref:PH domain-containing protein n=1 Tax=Brevibacillus borstelensis TaxID=45462 RepID=UPI0030D09AF7
MFFGQKQAELEINDLLFEGEEIVGHYKLVQDFICLTNKRVIFVDKAISSNKRAIISIPYDNVESVEMERGKILSIGHEFTIVTKKREYDIHLAKDVDPNEFYRTLTKHICT